MVYMKSQLKKKQFSSIKQSHFYMHKITVHCINYCKNTYWTNSLIWIGFWKLQYTTVRISEDPL